MDCEYGVDKELKNSEYEASNVDTLNDYYDEIYDVNTERDVNVLLIDRCVKIGLVCVGVGVLSLITYKIVKLIKR